MKKLFAISIAIFVAVSAFAQPGIVAGLTSSSTDISSESIANANNYHVGLAYKADLGIICIQPAVIYNVKGQAVNAITQDGLDGIMDHVKADIDFKTGFIEVPVQLQAGVHLGHVLRVFGFVEPFVGYAITNETNVSITSAVNLVSGLSLESKQNTWDNVKNRLEYGCSLGAGIEVIDKIQLSLKYFWNLGDLYKDGQSYGNLSEAYQGISSSLKETKCNGIALSVGFFF